MRELFFGPRGISYRLGEFRPERSTLVFIHGLSGSCSAWFEYEKIFGDRFNIINLDILGHGNSQKPRRYEDYAVEKQAEAISELLTDVGVEEYVVISHSFGTLMALELLLVRKQPARAAIFLSPPYAIDAARMARFTRLLADMAAAVLRVLPFSMKIRGRTDYSKYPNSGDWNIPRMFCDIRNTTLTVYFFCLSQLYKFKQTAKWERLRLPTQIIQGKLDSLVPFQHSVLLHETMPGSKLILLDHADHILVLNNVREVCEIIEKFLAAQPPLPVNQR